MFVFVSESFHWCLSKNSSGRFDNFHPFFNITFRTRWSISIDKNLFFIYLKKNSFQVENSINFFIFSFLIIADDINNNRNDSDKCHHKDILFSIKTSIIISRMVLFFDKVGNFFHFFIEIVHNIFFGWMMKISCFWTWINVKFNKLFIGLKYSFVLFG